MGSLRAKSLQFDTGRRRFLQELETDTPAGEAEKVPGVYLRSVVKQCPVQWPGEAGSQQEPPQSRRC